MKKHLINLSKKLKNYNLYTESNIIDDLIKLASTSSVSSIVSLGYPHILAKIIREMFGNNAFLIAKWIKEFYGDEFLTRIGGNRSLFHKSDLELYLEMYKAAENENIDEYRKFREQNELSSNDDFIDFPEIKMSAINEIKKIIKNDIFFYNSFTSAILRNEIKNINEYKKLSLKEAIDKYNNKKVFQEAPVVKSYPEGYRWIDVGAKCELIGEKMKNCGSAGIMSSDPDKTILALFDENNNPHVLVTYAPNEKIISGYEGKAGTEPKDEYIKYILDLENILGANINTHSEGAASKLLKLKVLLKNFAKEIERIPCESIFNEYFKITDFNNNVYYSNFYEVIPIDIFNFEVLNVKKEELSNGTLNDYLNIIFNHRYNFAIENKDKIKNPYSISHEIKTKNSNNFNT